jgi:hypothetical protein
MADAIATSKKAVGFDFSDDYEVSWLHLQRVLKVVVEPSLIHYFEGLPLQ